MRLPDQSITVYLQIPGILRWPLPACWSAEQISEFLAGVKTSWLSDRQIPRDDWPALKRRGFMFGEKVISFCEKHHINQNHLTKAGVLYGSSDYYQSYNRGTGARALF
jgi:hypothetical protein